MCYLYEKNDDNDNEATPRVTGESGRGFTPESGYVLLGSSWSTVLVLILVRVLLLV